MNIRRKRNFKLGYVDKHRLDAYNKLTAKERFPRTPETDEEWDAKLKYDLSKISPKFKSSGPQRQGGRKSHKRKSIKKIKQKKPKSTKLRRKSTKVRHKSIPLQLKRKTRH